MASSLLTRNLDQLRWFTAFDSRGEESIIQSSQSYEARNPAKGVPHHIEGGPAKAIGTGKHLLSQELVENCG